MKVAEALKKIKILLGSVKMTKIELSYVKLTQEQLADGNAVQTGSLIQYDGEIEQGDVIYLVDPAGNLSVLPDGSFTTKSGTSFVIEDGTVSSVSDVNTPEPSKEPVKQAQASDDKSQKPYGDVKYADPGYLQDKEKRYPLDTEEHIRSAWNYINVEKNADEYSGADLKKVKSSIIQAWEDKIDKAGPPSAQTKSNMEKETKEPAETKLAEDSTPVAAAATVDVNDLIASAIAAALAPFQAQLDTLSGLILTQVNCSKDTETKLSATETKLAAAEKEIVKLSNQPAGQPAEKEINTFVAAPSKAISDHPMAKYMS